MAKRPTSFFVRIAVGPSIACAQYSTSFFYRNPRTGFTYSQQVGVGNGSAFSGFSYSNGRQSISAAKVSRPPVATMDAISITVIRTAIATTPIRKVQHMARVIIRVAPTMVRVTNKEIPSIVIVRQEPTARRPD